jgi:hypothetical protein
VSFERPLFLLLLLLALPWIFWLRQREPREYAVGGLGPFRPFARAAGARPRGWPLSLLCALGALICASLALARPIAGAGSDYLVLDRSLSVRSCGLPEPAARGRQVLASEGDVLTLLSQLPDRARAEVWTDLPAPEQLPERIRWNDEAFQSFTGPNAAILVARPLAPDRWLVHWIAEAGAASLQLVADTGERADLGDGVEGLSEITASAAATRLELRTRDGNAPDARLDQHWSIEPGAWTLPTQWDSRWEQVAAAAWPGFRIVRAGSGANAPFASDPLAGLADLDAVAFLAERLRATADAIQPPRPASECRTGLHLGAWQEGIQGRDGGDGPFSGWLGGIGAAFLLLSLVSHVILWRARSDFRNATS